MLHPLLQQYRCLILVQLSMGGMFGWVCSSVWLLTSIVRSETPFRYKRTFVVSNNYSQLLLLVDHLDVIAGLAVHAATGPHWDVTCLRGSYRFHGSSGKHPTGFFCHRQPFLSIIVTFCISYVASPLIISLVICSDQYPS